jgi:hypothetical protein
MHDEPFPARLDSLDHSASYRRVIVYARKRRETSFEAGDSLAGECAVERACRAEDCVALRH